MAIRVLATIPELARHPSAVEIAPHPAPRRVRPRASFPGVSITALALVAAAVWSLVAFREATRPAADPATHRIAAEATEAGVTETTVR